MSCTSEAPQRKRCTSFIDLVARLRFLFVGPCAARSSAQVTWTRGRGHPTVPGARWRSPLALTSDHPPPIHPFVFEAVAPRKLVSQLREITFSGPLASFVGKNFDTRQDACWGQLRDEAVCSPSKAHTRQIGGERGWWWVRRGERERAQTDVSSAPEVHL